MAEPWVLGFRPEFCLESTNISLECPGPEFVGRVIAVSRNHCVVMRARGAAEVAATVPGRMFEEAGRDPKALPAVGDFVLLARTGDQGMETWRIDRILPRWTLLSRRGGGGGGSLQLIAANVDLVAIVTSANADLNERRLERYLVAVWESGAQPVIVLTKSDLCPDLDAAIARIRPVAAGAALVVTSLVDGRGIADLNALCRPGVTLAMVGSSGVGKSSLINVLTGRTGGAAQAVRAISEHLDKGRHTTTARELLVLPGGAMVIDTPGMREFMPEASTEAVAAVFDEVSALALTCRFTSCRHEGDPGCAVESAIRDGALTRARVTSWRKLEREQERLAAVKESREKRRLQRQARHERYLRSKGRNA